MSALADFLALRPAGGYRAVIADPPWSFENYSERGEAKGAKPHYGCMPVEQMALLPVQALAAADSLLWMWATFPMLPEAITLMQAWGFTYKTGGAWHKTTASGKTAFGTGYILRSACEPFIVGTIGSPRIASHSIRNVIVAERREHSRKPVDAHEAIEALFPEQRYLELFARASRPGWDAWGNEVGKFDEEAA